VRFASHPLQAYCNGGTFSETIKKGSGTKGTGLPAAGWTPANIADWVADIFKMEKGRLFIPGEAATAREGPQHACLLGGSRFGYCCNGVRHLPWNQQIRFE